MEEIHPLAWTAWLAAAALPALLTRNPLYLSLALLATWVTNQALSRKGDPESRSWRVFVRFGALLWLLTIPFTMLTAHYGRLVFFSLPAAWPVIGGSVTGEALLYGLSSGLALITLLLAFATFNLAVDQARLLRLTPGFLYQAGIITAIAVAFVPQMIGAWQSVREAQEVRGHRVRGPRDLLPLIIPLLVTALERAMQLAESMEARGFGRQMAPICALRRSVQQLAVLVGLALVAAGVAGLGFWPDRPLRNGLLLAAGAGFLAVSFWDQGRRVARSHYRRWRWHPAARVLCAASGLVILGWLGLQMFQGGGDWLMYYPYPPFSPWPTFHWVAGTLAMTPAVAGLFVPAATGLESDTISGRAETAGEDVSAAPDAAQPASGKTAFRPLSFLLRLISAFVVIWRN